MFQLQGSKFRTCCKQKTYPDWKTNNPKRGPPPLPECVCFKSTHFHLLSATGPKKKQTTNDEHPSSQKNNAKNLPPKTVYFLFDLLGTASGWAPCEASATRTIHAASFCPSWQRCQMQLGIPLSHSTVWPEPWLLSTNIQWFIMVYRYSWN